MIDATFLRQLNRFQLIFRKKVTSSFIGQQKSASYGTGNSYNDSREYRPGDDIRLIDWNVYARTDKLFIKRYEEEKNLTVHVIIDYSKSMGFGDKVSKFHYSCMLGIGFAYLAMKKNDRFEFSTFADELNAFNPRRGQRSLAEMVDMLNNMKTKGKSNFDETMLHYKKTINSRSLIIIISDFLIDLDKIQKGLQTIGRTKHEIKVIQVLDRTEKEFDIDGEVKLRDSETNEILNTYFSKRMKKQYQDELDEHGQKLHSVCNTLGIEFYSITTDNKIFDVFYRLLEQ
jgi:uncharacterized protein (DUF58 family)